MCVDAVANASWASSLCEESGNKAVFPVKPCEWLYPASVTGLALAECPVPGRGHLSVDWLNEKDQGDGHVCSGLRKLSVGRSLGLSSSCTLCGLHQSSVMSEAWSSVLCDVTAEPPAHGHAFPGPVAPSLFLSCSGMLFWTSCVCVSSSQGYPISDVTSILSPAEWPVGWVLTMCLLSERSCRVSPGAPDDAWIGNRCPVKSFWR